jgi:phenylacetate-coenzyme A ligase PaaK-like adenylate-forming protein
MSWLESLRLIGRGLAEHRIRGFTPGQVAVRRELRLRHLLRHAAAHSPFYREKFRGLDLAHCPLAELPVTTKPELVEHFDDVVTDRQVRLADLERFTEDPANGARLFRGQYHVTHTSGSSGQALIVLQEPADVELLFLLQFTRGNAAFTRGLLEVLGRVRQPARLVAITNPDPFNPSCAVWVQMPPAFGRFAEVIRLDSTDPDLTAKLEQHQPTNLSAYPSILDPLSLDPSLPRWAGRLRQVTSSSENLSPPARQRIASAFGAPVLDNYSMAECTILTMGCPAGPGCHVNADWVILEVVDDECRPVPAGELGRRILITHLSNRIQPLIRYEVNDRVCLAVEPCACGSRLPRLAAVEGRSADVFLVEVAGQPRRLTGLSFKHAFDHMGEVREWQAVQVQRNRVRLRVEVVPGRRLDEPRLRHLLGSGLRAAGLDEAVALEIETVPRLAPDPRTGKVRRVVSLLPPADTQAPVPAENLSSSALR